MDSISMLREGEKMSGTGIALLRENAFRAYIIVTCSPLYTVKNNATKEHERIVEAINSANIDATFAHEQLTRARPKVPISSELRAMLVNDLRNLQNGYFGSVWFCGDTTSDFTRAVALMAAKNKIALKNYSERGSVLDRFLKKWILRFDTLP